MTDDKPKKPSVRQDFIKGGGTATTGNEQMRARVRADSERRRADHDRKVAASRGTVETKRDASGSQVIKTASDMETQHHAAMYTRDLGGISSHAGIVLAAESKDREIFDYIICNLVVEDAALGRFLLVMVCPSCLHKQGKSLEESHITLRSYHRPWSLHEKNRGEVWINPKLKEDPDADPKAVTLAGSIETHEAQTCPTCAFRFEIGPAKKTKPDDPVVSGAVRAA